MGYEPVVQTVRNGSDVPAVGVCTGASIASNSAYTTMSGTSMACPHVTGAIALLMAKEVRPFLFYIPTSKKGCKGMDVLERQEVVGGDRALEGGEGPCSTS